LKESPRRLETGPFGTPQKKGNEVSSRITDPETKKKKQKMKEIQPDSIGRIGRAWEAERRIGGLSHRKQAHGQMRGFFLP